MASSTEPSSINQRAIRGAIWTIAGYGISNAIRLGSNLILTRLLVPELFGLMALVYVFISGLHMFSDVGIGVSIIQNKRGDERSFLDTAWTIQVIRGFILWFACLLLAYPVSQLYSEPRLLWLVPIVGLTTVISGFNCTALFSLNRHLDIKAMALFELSGQLVGAATIILWAWFHPTIWAIVAGGLVSAVYQLILSWRIRPAEHNRFAWEKTATQEIFSFGTWIFLSTAMTFFGEQADRLILGKILGFTLLGVYGIALTLADLPRSVTTALAGKVMMPALSMIADQPRATIRSKICRKRKPILVAMAVGVAVLAAGGDALIRVLYDQRYHEATWMLPVLALGIWPRLLCNTIEPVLFAIGKPQYTAAANLSRFICTAVGISIGFSLFGLPGAVIGVALNDLCYYCVISYGLQQEKLSACKQDFIATGILFCVLAGLVILRYGLGFGLPIDDLLR
jgi:O-antigen/teichoic acid export membrane protein